MLRRRTCAPSVARSVPDRICAREREETPVSRGARAPQRSFLLRLPRARGRLFSRQREQHMHRGLGRFHPPLLSKGNVRYDEFARRTFDGYRAKNLSSSKKSRHRCTRQFDFFFFFFSFLRKTHRTQERTERKPDPSKHVISIYRVNNCLQIKQSSFCSEIIFHFIQENYSVGTNSAITRIKIIFSASTINICPKMIICIRIRVAEPFSAPVFILIHSLKIIITGSSRYINSALLKCASRLRSI